MTDFEPKVLVIINIDNGISDELLMVGPTISNSSEIPLSILIILGWFGKDSVALSISLSVELLLVLSS